jgi:hypothetical protein
MKIAVLTQSEAGVPRPRAFQLGGRRVSVVAVLDQWQAHGHRYFQVRDMDGRRFVLRHCGESWELEGVYGRAAKPTRAAA